MGIKRNSWQQEEPGMNAEPGRDISAFLGCSVGEFTDTPRWVSNGW